MPIITQIQALPTSPFEGTGYVGIVITSNVPSYFKVIGIDLDRIVSIRWYPENPSSVMFETRQFIPVDNTLGTFMIRVTDNFLNIIDRAGMIVITFDDDTTFSAPVKTYGPVSCGPLWNAPNSGLITG